MPHGQKKNRIGGTDMKWILMLIPYILIIGGNIGILVYVLTSISKIKKQQQEILGKLNELVAIKEPDGK